MTMSSLKDKTLLLLGLLNHEEMHGYKLNKMLKDSQKTIQIGKANAYKILGMLEKKGFVVQRVKTQSNRPSRIIYSITEEGNLEFNRLLRERLAESEQFDYPDGVSLDFIGLIEPQEAISLLEKRLERLAARCSTFHGYSDDIRASHPGLDIFIEQAKLEYKMMNKLIKKLKEE